VARVLIVAGGCRGRRLARSLGEAGHAVRITTRSEAGRAAIEAAGAECWIGTPDRIATLRYALENVTLLCWLLGSASGDPEAVAALHASRLQFMLSQAIDTTVRGVIYEAAGSVDPQTLGAGAELVRAAAERNEIPYRVLRAAPGDAEAWLGEVQAAVGELL
jgi:hypothetical protein